MNTDENDMKRILRLDKSQNRQANVKPEPLVQDTFSCTIGTHRCPVKKQNVEQAEQLLIKEETIHNMQEQLEGLRGRVEAESLKEKPNHQKIYKELIESDLLKEKEIKIKGFEKTVSILKERMQELHVQVSDMAREKEEFMTTALEADLYQRKKYYEYRQLTKKCDTLTVRIENKRLTDNALNRAIAQKKAYDSELTKSINSQVDVIKELGAELARLRVEHRSYKKVKPEIIEKKGIVRKILEIAKKPFTILRPKNA